MCFIDEKRYVSDPESDAIIKELQRMMDKVEEMKNQ
jgi:phosphoribosylformylglycinamidine (FGAM) synthase PurS component